MLDSALPGRRIECRHASEAQAELYEQKLGLPGLAL
jgi:hypothetical protein